MMHDDDADDIEYGVDEYEDEDEGGELFTLEEWKNAVDDGVVTPYDGSAWWVDAEGEEHVLHDWLSPPDAAKHIIFYGK